MQTRPINPSSNDSSRWQTSGPGIPTKPYSLHPYQYAYSNPVLHKDPTGLCVPESDGPLACDPSLRSSLQNYLRDSRPFDNRARGDQGYQGINVVFDRYPSAAYAYEVGRDTELRVFVTAQLPWVDADATLAQLAFNLQQWKLNYAQRNNLDPDLDAATVGMLGLGAVFGIECFFGPDGGRGGGGATREVILPTKQSFEQARNQALELLGEINPATRSRVVARLPASGARGQVVGFETEVGGVWKRFRLDYDPVKRAHINVEIGKGPTAKRYVVPWEGTEQDFLNQVKRLR